LRILDRLFTIDYLENRSTAASYLPDGARVP
jgi:hypothetical protein